MFENIDALLKLRKAWTTFSANHPGVAGFSREVASRELSPGTVIDVRLSYPDGSELSTNMRVSEEDVTLLSELQAIAARKK